MLKETHKINPRLHVALHLAAATALGLAGWAVGSLPMIALHWRPYQSPIFSTSLILLLAGAFHRRKIIARLSSGICLSVLALLLLLTISEIGFRVIGFNFRHDEANWRKLPPFYRRPRVPIGMAFSRREGPEVWSGQVIKKSMDLFHMSSDAYGDEPPITVRYDSRGFRNERWPALWEVAVAGDSFVELGNLPFEQLFTTILGRLTHRQVLNLGVSNVGPLTELCYLENFGVSQRTRQVVVVFYEGNDLQDLASEYKAQSKFEATGARQVLQFKKQTSMLRALGEDLSSPPVSADSPRVNGYFHGATGNIPMTLISKLETNNVVRPNTERILNYFLERYSAFGKARNVQTWLAFMPCKARALDGQFEWVHPAETLALRPIAKELPSIVAEKCSSHGIRFIDLTPALNEEGKKTHELLYNSIFDSHLNARGSDVVAHALAQKLEKDFPHIGKTK